MLKTAGILGLVNASAILGTPELVGIAAFGTTLIIAVCWILANDGRAERLALLIQAIRTTQPKKPQALPHQDPPTP